jgi:hypothetical protein
MPIGWQCVLASAQNIFRCTAVTGSRAASATRSLRDDDRIIRNISRQLNTGVTPDHEGRGSGASHWNVSSFAELPGPEKWQLFPVLQIKMWDGAWGREREPLFLRRFGQLQIGYDLVSSLPRYHPTDGSIS